MVIAIKAMLMFCLSVMDPGPRGHKICIVLQIWPSIKGCRRKCNTIRSRWILVHITDLFETPQLTMIYVKLTCLHYKRVTMAYEKPIPMQTASQEAFRRVYKFLVLQRQMEERSKAAQLDSLYKFPQAICS